MVAVAVVISSVELFAAAFCFGRSRVSPTPKSATSAFLRGRGKDDNGFLYALES